MKHLIQRLLGKPTGSTASDAKQRLKVLLVHDEIDLPPAKLSQMKAEIMDVIAKYVDVEDEGVEFKLHKEDGVVALVTNVPVRKALSA